MSSTQLGRREFLWTTAAGAALVFGSRVLADDFKDARDVVEAYLQLKVIAAGCLGVGLAIGAA